SWYCASSLSRKAANTALTGANKRAADTVFGSVGVGVATGQVWARRSGFIRGEQGRHVARLCRSLVVRVVGAERRVEDGDEPFLRVCPGRVWRGNDFGIGIAIGEDQRASGLAFAMHGVAPARVLRTVVQNE